MDPNANLAEQLALAGEILDNPRLDVEELLQKGERLAELVLALQTWLRGGGPLPDVWCGPQGSRQRGESK